MFEINSNRKELLNQTTQFDKHKKCLVISYIWNNYFVSCLKWNRKRERERKKCEIWKFYLKLLNVTQCHRLWNIGNAGIWKLSIKTLNLYEICNCSLLKTNHNSGRSFLLVLFFLYYSLFLSLPYVAFSVCFSFIFHNLRFLYFLSHKEGKRERLWNLTYKLENLRFFLE